ncbi:TPA: maturation control protein [Salmonella enterica subsp. enterica serovar Havana]|uniref:maturation control protein n=2 Tax=Salmonella enterica TaxID=28901 RepID=UPI001274E5F0|nr:maturation control protein [Salmonella enterica]EBQ8819922.1 maturation control protein [Salmonella enterica subsp. enterica serovar Kisarawe]EBV7175762.1 maturation control protein [Salmonella enterica subsp. enterica serovar Thompson]ECE8260878.1 maturation control protein [Salmonella enterica subsp. enterica serovar Hvittingfoss]EDV4899463.1 maturation control protein [Salmonella enterica subsp. enterica]EHM5757920.1 maturation control protein [Salmonella enterica subsp. salamae serovar 
MDKKICAVCLTVGKPAMITAAWVNDELIMAERKNYPERRRAMELELLRDLREKEEKGFVVLVDEENSFITGRVGQRIRLRDEHTTRRPVLVEAMRIYSELDRQKAIKRPRAESGKYILHQSIFDADRDKKGEEFYNINWQELTTEHVLTLLCCYATEYNNIASADFIKAMTGDLYRQQEKSLIDPMLNIVRGVQRMAEKRVPQGKLTGKGNIL